MNLEIKYWLDFNEKFDFDRSLVVKWVVVESRDKTPSEKIIYKLYSKFPDISLYNSYEDRYFIRKNRGQITQSAEFSSQMESQVQF